MTHGKVECVWNTGSSCHTTGKSVQPTKCQKKNCQGIFNSFKGMADFCDMSIPKHDKIQSVDSVRRFVNRYDADRKIEVGE